MTLKSIREYVLAIRDRYRKATGTEKGKILDELVKVAGYHRKAIIRVLLKKPELGVSHRGRPTSYATVV